METPSPDRLIEFIIQRGEAGVTTSELTSEFLRPSSAPPELCERILRAVLEREPRVRELPGGRWAPDAAKEPRPPESYTVVESLAAPVSTRRSVEVEAAALRVSETGEADERLTVVIRPEPYPPTLVLPHRLRASMRSAPAWDEAVERVADLASGSALVCFRLSRFASNVNRRLIERGRVAPVLQLQRLSRAVLGLDASRTREAMAVALGCTEPEILTAGDAARATMDALAAFLERGMGRVADILAAQHPARREVDFADYAFTRKDIDALPATPGIYIMRNANGEAVYVGKARDLRQRVASYFRSRIERDERVEAILRSSYTLETQPAGSELEALLLEYRTIRDLAPTVNLQFAVHERPAAQQAEGRRAIAVLPSVRPRCAELFMARGVEAFRQGRISGRWAEKSAEEVRRFFFDKNAKPEGDPAEAQIFWSWYTRRRDEVRMIDVDAAGGAAEVVRLCEELARDVLEGGPRMFRV